MAGLTDRDERTAGYTMLAGASLAVAVLLLGGGFTDALQVMMLSGAVAGLYLIGREYKGSTMRWQDLLGKYALVVAFVAVADFLLHIALGLNISITDPATGIIGWGHMDLGFIVLETWWYFLVLTGAIGGGTALLLYEITPEWWADRWTEIFGRIGAGRPLYVDVHIGVISLIGGLTKSLAYPYFVGERHHTVWESLWFPGTGISTEQNIAFVTFFFGLLHAYAIWFVLRGAAQEE